MINEIVEKFKDLYQQESSVLRSPGRVILIGEHTDYNEGLVLPAAINKDIFFAVAPNKTKSLRVHAYDLGEDATFDLD